MEAGYKTGNTRITQYRAVRVMFIPPQPSQQPDAISERFNAAENGKST